MLGDQAREVAVENHVAGEHDGGIACREEIPGPGDAAPGAQRVGFPGVDDREVGRRETLDGLLDGFRQMMKVDADFFDAMMGEEFE